MPPDASKQKKKPKSSLQLKRERIVKNLAIVEEKARLFREKINSMQNIYIPPENESATNNP